MSDLLVIDPLAIENLRALSPGDDDAFLREIANMFLEDTPLRIAELNESLQAGDVARFTRAAHSIKGSSANLGAMALRGAAGRLEEQARTNGLGDVAELIDGVRTEFARARTQLCTIVPDGG
jgi:histidine phosphotransfer protein HptB